jgi:hypothetical protein
MFCRMASVMVCPSWLCEGYESFRTLTLSVLSCQWCRCSRSFHWRVEGWPRTLKMRSSWSYCGGEADGEGEVGEGCEGGMREE